MSRLVVGVIGHVDHGKSALVRALTGRDTDRLPEEKARGISIALGFAYLESAAGDTIDLIDMPGHERFVRTMISGATGIDAVLLVVAANEGVQPQTVEHADIAALLGIRRALVAVTKCDLVSPDEALLVARQATELLAERGVDASAPLLTSASTGEGIDALRAALEGLAARQQARSADGIVFLPVDRAFTMTGHGPVVTGTLRGSTVTAGDTLELLPLGREVRVRGVQVHGAKVANATPGQRTALNLRGVDTGELARGMALATPGALALSPWLTISIRAVEGAAPLKNGMRLRALYGTAEVDARLRLLDRDVLEAGDEGFAQLHLSEPAALPAGEHVILRLPSPPSTLAGGRVLEPETRRLRRHCPQVLERLAELASLPPDRLVAAEVEREGKAGVSLAHLSRLSGLGVPAVVELLLGLPVVVTKAGLVTTKADLDRLLARIPVLLGLHREGLPAGRLRAALAGVGPALVEEALSRLLAQGRIAKRGPLYLVPRPDDDRRRAHSEEQLALRLAEALRSAGLSPPTPREILTDHHAKRAIERLLREGTVIRAFDRAKNKEILFHRDAIAEARRRLAPLLASGEGMLVTEIGQALGISRKYTMPLLDHLDSIRFTQREGDRRVLAGKAE